MDKHNKAKDWFEMESVPDATGRYVRYYEVACHSCGTKAKYHANRMSDEQLRKVFIAKGWTIGRTKNSHFCGGCSIKRKAPSPTPVPAAPLVAQHPFATLLEAWEKCSNSERELFLSSQPQLINLLDKMNQLERSLEFALAELDAAPAAAPNGAAPIERPEAPPLANDEEPAPWWREATA